MMRGRCCQPGEERWFAPVAVLWLICLMPGMSGCRRGLSCETLAERNNQCADAFVAYAKEQVRPKYEREIEQLPESERPAARRKLAAKFAIASREIRKEMASKRFLNECKASWNDPEKFPAKQKQKLEQCLASKDCPTYARCFMEAANTDSY